MNGLTLAYLGDAYFELKVRKYLVDKGLTKVNQLHNEAVKFTSSVAQREIITYLLDEQILNEKEISSYKRGRNNSTSGRKNVDAKTYVEATGFEALIGYLYINDLKRLDEIIDISINYIVKGESLWAKN